MQPVETNQKLQAPPGLDLPDELPEGYYLENFEFLLRFVLGRYHDLLTDEERTLAEHILALDDNVEKLFVRLSNRKGSLFRLDKLNYPELGDLETLVAELEDRQLVDMQAPDRESAVMLLSKDELLSLECTAGMPKNSRKDLLIERVLAEEGCHPTIELDVPVLEVLGQEQLQLFKLLFFGNFHQDMTEFVLHELVAPFESYDLSEASSFFTDRDVVDMLVHLKGLSDESQLVVAEDADGEACLALRDLLPERPAHPTPARRFDRIINRLGRHLERLELQQDALATYRLGEATPSRERQARILVKLEQVDEALSLCEDILETPLDEEELEFARSFGARMAKKYGRRFGEERPAPVSAHGQITVQRTCDSVEQCAVEYYQSRGADCHYVENTLFRGLFGLAFWDIIFAPVHGVFFHPFQRGPTDLYLPEFRLNRQQLIEARFEALRDPVELRSIVSTHFQSKWGIANQFVNWTWLDANLIDLALNRVPVLHLLSIFERLLSDLKANSSGFPDLILFTDDGYRLIEIKGPGDKIQKNQSRWFRHFEQHGIPAELVNVEYET